MVYIATTYDNDFIEKINGNDINMTVYDFITANPSYVLYNGGTDYEDIEFSGTTSDVWELTNSGVIAAVELLGGSHPPHRPK